MKRRPTTMTKFLLAGLALAWPAAGAVGAADPPTSQMSCSEVSSLRLPDVRISTAEAVTPAGDAKAHCRVAGVIGKEVRFEFGKLSLPFDAEEFLLSFSQPNYSFHAATAYDILRMLGIKIGKTDFLGRLRMRR